MQKSRGRKEACWLVVSCSQGPGRFEVLQSEGGFICEPCLTVKRLKFSDKMDIIKDSKDKQNGKLQVLGTTEELVIQSIETASRSGSKGAWRGSAGNKKTYTPTRKISCALKTSPGREKIFVKDTMDKKSNKIPQSDTLKSRDDGQENARVNKHVDKGESVDVVDLDFQKTFNKVPEERRLRKLESWDRRQRSDMNFIGQKIEGEKEKPLEAFDSEYPAVEFQSPSTDVDNINDKLSNVHINKDGEDEDSSGDLSEKEDEREKAPLELLGEFLAALMNEDYKLASKLCQMILIYEPENPEAKQFLPLIEKKLLMEETEQNPGDENDEETDDDSSDETDDTTSDESESEEDSEETSDELSEQEGGAGNFIKHNLLGW
uniref:Glutamate-rich protein 2 isoform X2 n=2 Tax=Geotrypetes seraphini TaxID=260995 RepID=A0A6P8R599_GEOSA|nr:glutamate-rich protein 2 isoform X2 [Geotrypetes seraphini]